MSFQRKRPTHTGPRSAYAPAVNLESDEIVEWVSDEIVRMPSAIQRRRPILRAVYHTQLFKTIAVSHRLGEGYARASTESGFFDTSQTRR